MAQRWSTHAKTRCLSPVAAGARWSVRLRLGAMAGAMVVGTVAIALAQGASGSNQAAWIGVDLFEMVRTADPVGQLSLVVLACFSITSLSVIVYKWLHIRQTTRQTEDFIELCNQGSGELEEAFKLSSSFPDSPLAQILREGYTELELENWYRGEGYDMQPEVRIEMAKISMERIFERSIAAEITHLESKLIFLATTSSVCPFIGLFGTVWGIMNAFQSIEVTGGSLVALGPGLSTALLTTVGGLFCAIPATVMYNYLTHRIRILTAQMDSFALELSNIIQKQIIKQSAAMTAGRSL